MNEIIIKYDRKGSISNFAFATGIAIERLIKEETNNLEKRNTMLEAKILDFYMKLKEPFKSEYANYFGLAVQREGHTK